MKKRERERKDFSCSSLNMLDLNSQKLKDEKKSYSVGALALALSSRAVFESIIN